MNTNVLRAIFRRNFVAYFSSPTGYVFITLFMVASSFCAFWFDEFFNANLANLDQLNSRFLWLMLAFVPTITMSIWADERRQGTDELLLTIPANDFEVVVGKYLAAVAIFSVSLLFSLVTNFVMLSLMGQPDIGLFVANYVGYWFVGAAMIALGMVGSFLTGNLTVAFVLGVAFVLPFVITQLAASFVSWRAGVDFAKRWSFVGPFEDFTRGVISLSSVAYFTAVALFGLYVCMILIGRRHWLGGRDGSSLLGHYLVRGVALVAIAASVIFVFTNHDVIRADATAARLNSLSKDTKDLLATVNAKEADDLKKRRADLEKELAAAKKAADAKKDDKELQKAVDKAEQRLRQVALDEDRIEKPIAIDAYISREVPEAYAAKRLDLISKLREFENLSKGKVAVTIYDIDPFSVAADQAKDRHGIEARRVNYETRGQFQSDDIYLGASVRSGLNEVVIEFFELGVPVEYELIQAIVTVSQSQRKTLGVVKTDADLFGGTFNFSGGVPESTQQQPIIRELKKHYDVVDVDPNEKIVDPDDPNARKYHALLVVQPSSLTPPQLSNLSDAVLAGIPTAIFEDPFPFWMQEVPGTDQPKMPRQPMGMMMPPPPQEKGNLDAFFGRLGIRMLGDRFEKTEEDLARMSRGHPTDYESLIVWQRYNPYPALRFSEGLTNEWVFVNDNAPKAVDKEGSGCFSDDPITKGLYELLYLFPGGIIHPSQEEVDKYTATVNELTKTVEELTQESNDASDAEKMILDEQLDHAKKNLDLAKKNLHEARKRRAKFPATYTPLVRTGEESGTIRYRHIEEAFRSRTPFMMREHEVSKPGRHCLAARVQGEIELSTPPAQLGDDSAPPPAPKKAKVNLIVVSDVDMLHREFFRLRANPIPGLDLQFQNVPFVLNVIDALADDPRFIEIRKGRQLYGHLTRVEQVVEQVVTSEIERQIEDAESRYKRIEENAEKTRREAVETAQKQFDEMKKKGELNISAIKALEDRANMTREMATVQELLDKDRAEKEFKKERDKAIEEGKRRTYALNDLYKWFAVIAPPVLPFVAGIVVFFYRRSREQEGVAKSRLR